MIKEMDNLFWGYLTLTSIWLQARDGVGCVVGVTAFSFSFKTPRLWTAWLFDPFYMLI